MKKWIFSTVLLLSLTALPHIHSQEMINHDKMISPRSIAPDDIRYVDPDSVRTGYLSVKGEEIRGFGPSSLKKMDLAFQVLEEVVNSEEFKNKVINFKNDEGERSFKSNNGLSNEQIYSLFMEGREVLQPETSGEMNFYLKLYHRWWSRVIGYTNPGTNVIKINWKFFKKFKPHQVASNLAHEWVHKLGFGHESAKEHDSVPYGIGYIVHDMAEKLLKKKTL